jgi:DNA mismatch repair protein MLH1
LVSPPSSRSNTFPSSYASSYIQLEDFPILCERHTTSKLRAFDDLSKIATFGFRGEALASVTYVAHVSITSKTANSPCAYKASFSDGKLVAASVNGKAEPQPCAGVRGTTISAQDLFYNAPIRQRALSNKNDEFRRCVEVVTKYAVHYQGVSFTCKRTGRSKADVHTLIAASRKDTIRTLYGQAIARELLPLTHKDETLKVELDGLITNANFSTKKFELVLFINNRLVHCSSIRKAIDDVYSRFLPRNAHPFVYLSVQMAPQNVDVNVHPTKREVHFLNEDEIVQAIQKSFEETLAGANQSRTFYTQSVLSVSDAVSNTAAVSVSAAAAATNDSSLTRKRSYAEIKGSTDATARATSNRQLSLSDVKFDAALITPQASTSSVTVSSSNSRVRKKTRRDHDLVRTDSSNPQGRLEAFFKRSVHGAPKQSASKAATGTSTSSSSSSSNTSRPQARPRQLVNIDGSDSDSDSGSAPSGQNHIGIADNVSSSQKLITNADGKKQIIRRRPVLLQSVLTLREQVEADSCNAFPGLFKRGTFVGCVNDSFALMQRDTKLYLLNVPVLSRHLMYQRVLADFANFGRIAFSQDVPIRDLIRVALDAPESNWNDEDGDRDTFAENASKLITDRADMLADYFAIDIDEDGKLTALPQLVENYTPPLALLPLFLLRLASEVDWSSELECFRTLASELASFYALSPGMYINGESATSDAAAAAAAAAPNAGDVTVVDDGHIAKSLQQLQVIVQHTLFPAFRKHFVVPQKVLDTACIVQVADLHQMYKIFERC